MKAYKLFYLKDGKLYPPMVSNSEGKPTPVGVWLKAEAPEPSDREDIDRLHENVPEWLRRYHVLAGGRGTSCTRKLLSYRPGWHLCEIPYALQFNRGPLVDNPMGLKGKNGKIIKVRKYFPSDFVWAEVEYRGLKDYSAEARERMFYDRNGKRMKNPNHAYGGLNHLPHNGFYRYRTNANPATDEWIITDEIRVVRILSKQEADELVIKAGRKPQLIEKQNN